MSREMVDSGIEWIGLIPSNWTVLRLSSLFIEHYRKNEDNFERNLLSLSYGKIVQKNIDSLDGLLPASFENYNVISSGDIVLRLTDLQNDHTSLRTALSTQNGIITSAYVTLRTRSSNNSKFFSYLLYSYDICKVFYGLGAGVRQGLSFKNLKNLPMILPPDTDIHKISDLINFKCNQIDRLISIQEQQIEKLKEYKQSVISTAVTKGLDPNAPMKDSGIESIGKIPSSWEVKPLKTIANCNLRSLGENVDALREIEYVEIGNVTQEDGVLATERFAFKDAPSRARRLVQQGDVIVSTVRTYLKAVARIGVDQKDYVVSTGFAVIHPTDQISQDYLGNYLCSNQFTDLVSANSYGVQYPAINSSSLMNIKVITPPLPHQNSICNYLDQFNATLNMQILMLNEKISKLQEYKKSLIYEYVTGKKQVM